MTQNSSSKYCKYLCEYTFDNQRWSIVIDAQSSEEAKNRLRKISEGKVSGILKAKIPYRLGWIAKSWVWLTQLFA